MLNLLSTGCMPNCDKATHPLLGATVTGPSAPKMLILQCVVEKQHPQTSVSSWSTHSVNPRQISQRQLQQQGRNSVKQHVYSMMNATGHCSGCNDNGRHASL